jgi:hypothetical protein
MFWFGAPFDKSQFGVLGTMSMQKMAERTIASGLKERRGLIENLI